MIVSALGLSHMCADICVSIYIYVYTSFWVLTCARSARWVGGRVCVRAVSRSSSSSRGVAGPRGGRSRPKARQFFSLDGSPPCRGEGAPP